MKHLSSSEFVDAVDGVLPSAQASHLAACAACQAEVSELRSLMSAAATAGVVPEPSPLFWDHFSARVRTATSADPVGARRGWWDTAWRPFVAVGAMAIAAALVIVLRVGPDRGAPDAGADTRPVATIAETDVATSADEAGAIDMMAAVTRGLSWEEAQAATLTPARSTIDLNAVTLSDAQKREMMRLLEQEVGGIE